MPFAPPAGAPRAVGPSNHHSPCMGGSSTTSTPPGRDLMSEQDATTSPIEPWLRDILRCPACRSELRDETGENGPELVCTSGSCGLAYRIDDGVPVLLVDEARRPA